MRNNILSKILISILLLVSVVRYLRTGSSALSEDSIIFSIFIVLCSFVIYLFKKEQNIIYRHNYLNPVLIISLGMVIVYYFDYLSWILGFQPTPTDIRYYDASLLNKATIASSTAFISFLLGSLMVDTGFTKIIIRKDNNTISFVLDILLFLFVLFFVVSVDSNYFRGGYGSVDLDSESIWGSLADGMIQGGVLARVVSTSYRFKINNIKQYFAGYSLLFYFSVLFYLFLVMLSGDRGPIIYITMMYLGGLFMTCTRKLSFKTAIVGIIAAAFVLSLLSAIRHQGAGDFGGTRVSQGFIENEENMSEKGAVFALTRDLSRSVRPYNLIYEFSYDNGIVYGLGFINQTLGIIPGLRYVVYPLVGIDEESINTAKIATLIYGAEGYGLGTTCFGDIYFNFGYVGLIVVFFFFGAFIRKLYLSFYDKTAVPVVKIFAIGYFAYSIYIGRSTVFSPIKACAYACIFYYLVQLSVSKKNTI